MRTIAHRASLAAAAVAMLVTVTPAAAQYLYCLDTRYAAPVLRVMQTNGTVIGTTPLGSGTLPEGLALDPVNRRLYVTEAAWTGASLRRGASLQAIVTGQSVMRGVAVDAAGGSVWWTTSNLAAGSIIWRAALDGAAPATVAALGSNSNPRGIAFDAALQRLYFADFDQGTIRFVKPNGDSLRKLFGPGGGPYGVAIDPVARLVYWTGYRSGTLHRIGIDGANATQLYGALGRPTYVTLDGAGTTLYWVEADPPAVRSAPAAGGTITTLSTAPASYGGIVYSATAVAEVIETLPIERVSLAVSPNPARDGTTVVFGLTHAGVARLTVHDLQGRLVARLLDGDEPAGRHTVRWGGDAAPGVYFVRLAAEGGSWQRRVTLIP